ncbi:MAG: DUF362 domain-containing protein [Halobacteriota archaeon]
MSRVFKEPADGAAKYDFVARALDQFSDKIASASSIFIKPNLVSKEAYPTTTDPQLLDTVLQYLPDHALTVADGPAFDAPLNAFFDRKTRGVTKHHALKRVCDEHGVDFVNLNKGPFAKRRSDRGFSISLSTVPGSFDLKISLPVLKTHSICTLTGAVKNQFGLVRPTERVRLHASGLNLHKSIAEAALLEPFDIFIVDAVETLVDAQELRHGGRKAHLGYVLAGTDPVAIDCAGLELLRTVDGRLAGKTIDNIPHLAFAESYGLGERRHECMELMGT